MLLPAATGALCILKIVNCETLFEFSSSARLCRGGMLVTILIIESILVVSLRITERTLFKGMSPAHPLFPCQQVI